MRTVKYVLVEALLKGFGVEENSAEMKQVEQICGFERVPTKEIPVEGYNALMEWLAKHYSPTMTHSDSLLNVGVKFYEGYGQTILGRVQLANFKSMGPDRIVLRFPEFSAVNTNFGERWVEQKGPHNYIMAYRNIPLLPEYILGIFKGALSAYGIQKPTLKYTQIGPEDYDYTIAWE